MQTDRDRYTTGLIYFIITYYFPESASLVFPTNMNINNEYNLIRKKDLVCEGRY